MLQPFLARTGAYTVYRGVDLLGHWTDYEEGALIRFRTFTSTSIIQAQAEEFGPHLIEIAIPAGFRDARLIHSLSEFPEEQEMLFIPWSQFRVTRRDEAAGRVYLQALDIDEGAPYMP